MIRKFKEDDTTPVMTIWTKGNFKSHYFIDKDYWLLNFNSVKELLINSDTYIYEENEEIKGFISVLPDNCVKALFVKLDSLREGIGKRLLNYCKERYGFLTLNVYEKNMDAVLFFVAMGFKNVKMQIDENTDEKEYVMEWRANNA